MSRLVVFIIALLVMVLIAPDHVAHAADYESADCEFNVPQDADVECGFLTVPEFHDASDGDTIRLHVAVFKAHDENPEPDPIVYLDGGPGSSGLRQMENAYDLLFQSYNQNRDLVVFDQRGTGFSEPALNCPEFSEWYLDHIDEQLAIEDDIAGQFSALDACRERLLNEGIDLRAYNSRESAADLAALREALGYESWNLYGISYGTRLALTTVRNHPEGIRSVVLDSAYPLQVDLYERVAAHFVRSLDQLFADCAADVTCSTAYPDLENTFYDTVERLNEEPVLVQTTSISNLQDYDVLITGDVLAGFTFNALYQSQLLPSLPQLIHNASQNDFALMSLLYVELLQQQDVQLSYGMNISVQCNEEVPFGQPHEVSDYPRLDSFLRRQLDLGSPIYTLCADWIQNAQPDPIENQAVSSDIPTLVMAGEYDPITPPFWGQEVAKNLTESVFVEYPGTGHGASVSGDCPISMAVAFFDTPDSTLDDACIAEMGAPEFIVPLSNDINLVPLATDTFTSLRPAAWEELIPNFYGRPPMGDVGIMQMSLPGDSEMAMSFIFASLGEETPESELYQSENLEWTVYNTEFQGMVVNLAVTEGESMSYMVLLQATPSDAEALYTGVLIPVLNAFELVQ